jgi:hypothetical protein
VIGRSLPTGTGIVTGRLARYFEIAIRFQSLRRRPHGIIAAPC